MASMLTLFSLPSGIDVSYKTVERLYSDPEVEMALFNLHVLILKKKGVKDIDASGDSTGYALSIQRHYATEVVKRKDKAKTWVGKRAFAYSFTVMNIASKLYVAYGTSLRSEKAAFDTAMAMLKDSYVHLTSIRLDKYYSCPSYVDRFGCAKVFVIPRKNATLRGSRKWKETTREFVQETLQYLEQHYLRNNSESGFSADKRWFG